MTESTTYALRAWKLVVFLGALPILLPAQCGHTAGVLSRAGIESYPIGCNSGQGNPTDQNPRTNAPGGSRCSTAAKEDNIDGLVVPSPLADGDQPIVATYNGLSTQNGTPITVHQ